MRATIALDFAQPFNPVARPSAQMRYCNDDEPRFDNVDHGVRERAKEHAPYAIRQTTMNPWRAVNGALSMRANVDSVSSKKPTFLRNPSSIRSEGDITWAAVLSDRRRRLGRQRRVQTLRSTCQHGKLVPLDR